MSHAATLDGTGHDVGFHPRASPWVIAVVVTLAPFMEILDSTIVNVSLPHIAGSMSSSLNDATWTLTSYLVANGVVLPVAGWLGRVFGRKRYFLICIAGFTLFSLLCGLATNMTELVVFRLFQGLCGGGLQPTQQSFILDTFPPSQRGRGFSVVAIAVIFAPVFGPILGGWITDSYSWRWLFLINVPVGVFAMMAVGQLLEDPPWVLSDRARLRDIDAIGLGLIALGLGSLQYVLDRGEDADWFNSPTIRLFALLAAVGIAGAIAWLLLSEKPVVSLRSLRDRNFAAGVIVIFMIGLLLYSSNVVIPMLAQQLYGYTALLAGYLLSPGAVLMVLLIPLTAKLAMPNVQTRLLIAIGFFAMGCASLYALRLTLDADFLMLATVRAFQVMGLAFLFVPNSTIAYSTLPRSENADSAALYSMFRNISGSIGIALATAITANRTQVHRTYLAGHLSPLDPNYQALLSRHTETLQGMGLTGEAAHSAAMGVINLSLAKQSAILGYLDLFAYSAIAAFCVIPLTLLFRPGIAGRR
jgi:DHA2 family multidrug resistance protein